MDGDDLGVFDHKTVTNHLFSFFMRCYGKTRNHNCLKKLKKMRFFSYVAIK